MNSEFRIIASDQNKPRVIEEELNKFLELGYSVTIENSYVIEYNVFVIVRLKGK